MAVVATPSRAQGPAIRLSDATQSGAFNVGAGQAVVNRVVEPGEDQGALKIDFTLPKGTAAGVWAKAFPTGLDRAHIDIVRLAVKGLDPDQARRVNVALE